MYLNLNIYAMMLNEKGMDTAEYSKKVAGEIKYLVNVKGTFLNALRICIGVCC